MVPIATMYIEEELRNHLLTERFLGTYPKPGTVLDTQEAAVSETSQARLCLPELASDGGRLYNK